MLSGTGAATNACSLQWAVRRVEILWMDAPAPSRAPARLRLVLLVVVLGTLLGAAVSVAYVAGQPQPCCGSLKPFVSILPTPLSRIDATLAEGDGHAFAAIAEDPLMRRPEVFEDPRDFAYREQRPVWGYLAWVGSLGRAERVGWVLVVLTALSCGFATGVTGLLLLDRGRSAWWALLVPVVGFETLTELTPELFAYALLGLAVWCWARSRRGAAVVCLSFAALTRETMLFGVAALAAWEIWERRDDLRGAMRRVAVLVLPFLVYAAWIAVVRLRLGNWPFNRSNDRLGVPGAGFLDGLRRVDTPSTLLCWAVVGIGLVVTAVLLARRDPLTWIAGAFLALGAVLGPDVWITNAGYQRTLVPLFLCGATAAVGGWTTSRTRARAGAARTTELAPTIGPAPARWRGSGSTTVTTRS